MSTPTQEAREPMIDTPVVTLDGVKFGYVRELHGGYFKLDVPMAKDYWLSTSYISGSTPDQVSLTLRKDELDEHRLSAPGPDIEDSNSTQDSIISAAEALSQREKMERELELQNEKLRAGNV